MSTPINIFIIYAREDKEIKQRILRHLNPFKNAFNVAIWHDEFIQAGQEWKTHIDSQLQQTDLFLLLVSIDFMNSEFIHQVEFKHAIERHMAKKSIVVPVIINYCQWNIDIYFKEFVFNLEKLPALPTDARPIDDWKTPDQAFNNIAAGIRTVLETIKSNREKELVVSKKQDPETEKARKGIEEKQLERKREEKERRVADIDGIKYTSITSTGKFAKGIALTAANTITVQVNVAATGAYTISTDTVNGVSFSKSVTFSTTGVQGVVLTGRGTPLTSGAQNFIVIFGSSAYTFTLTFDVTFLAVLNGSNQVPANASTFTGSCVATFNPTTKILSAVTIHNVPAPTNGHFHKGAVGISGPVVLPFSTFTSPINYVSPALDGTMEADLMANLYYDNIHTAAFPAGEIRGQLIKQ